MRIVWYPEPSMRMPGFYSQKKKSLTPYPLCDRPLMLLTQKFVCPIPTGAQGTDCRSTQISVENSSVILETNLAKLDLLSV